MKIRQHWQCDHIQALRQEQNCFLPGARCLENSHFSIAVWCVDKHGRAKPVCRVNIMPASMAGRLNPTRIWSSLLHPVKLIGTPARKASLRSSILLIMQFSSHGDNNGPHCPGSQQVSARRKILLHRSVYSCNGSESLESRKCPHLYAVDHAEDDDSDLDTQRSVEVGCCKGTLRKPGCDDNKESCHECCRSHCQQAEECDDVPRSFRFFFPEFRDMLCRSSARPSIAKY